MTTSITKQLFSLTAILAILIAGVAFIPLVSVGTLIGVVAAAVVAVVWQKPHWGLYLMAALYPTIAFQFIRGGFNAPYVDLIAMLVAVVWGVKMLYLHITRRITLSFQMSPTMWLMLFFLVAAGLSLLAIDAAEFSLGVKFLFRPLLFFYLLYVVVPYNLIATKEQLLTVFKIMFGLGQAIALMGIYSIVIQPIKGVFRAVPVDVFGIWFLGSNHNQIAETLVVLIPIGFILYWITDDVVRKNLYALGTVFMIAVNFLTLSRAGWLAFVMEVAVIAFVFYRDRVMQFLKSYGFYILAVATAPFMYLMYRLVVSNIAASSNSNRLKLIEIALTLAKEHPVIGVGVGTFIDRVSAMHWYIVEYGSALDAHGFIFKVLAETGILGTVAFVSLLGYIMLSQFAFFKRERWTTYAPVALGMFLVIAAGVLFQLFGTAYYTSVLWFPIGVALASQKFGVTAQS